jgi:hypothetical protein
MEKHVYFSLFAYLLGRKLAVAMKKFQNLLRVSFLMFAYLLLSEKSNAQLSLGLKGGVNFSNLAVETETSNAFNTRVAPTFGVLLNYRISPLLSLQAEPTFSMRGATLEEQRETSLGGSVTYKVVNQGVAKLNYFELPILGQYRPRLSEKIEAIISFGPEARFLTAPVKLRTTSTTYVGNEPVEIETSERSLSGDEGLKKIDFGITAGAGVAYLVGTFKIFAEARYNLGLYNLSPENDGSKIHNRGASIFLGITVPVVK